MAKGMSETTPSLPDLLASKQVTAREVVLAEEKMRELKSIYHEMMVDLQRQKYYLRLANIQLHYPQPRIIVEKDKDGKRKTTKIYRTFIIQNAILEKDTNERGILAIQFRNVLKKDRKKVAEEIAVEEAALKKQGVNYKKLILPENYFDNYRVNIEIITESLYKTSLAKMQASVLEKLEVISKLFPQIFVVNQEEYFRQVSMAFDDDPEVYLEELSKLKELAKQTAQGAPEGGPGGPEAEPAFEETPVI